ncbi:MAG: hypothetical protein U0Z26_15275 [Anaerolineales bacterium]
MSSINLPSFVEGLLTGILIGVVTLAVYQFLHAILKQPRLTSRAVKLNDEDFPTNEARALFIAKNSLYSAIERRRLRNNKTKQILHAGYRNFRESWARDFGFAAFGLLAMKQYRVIKDTLEAFLDHQTEQGQLPVKLHSMSPTVRYFHSLFEREQPMEMPLRPKYLSAHGAPSLDGQALLVMAAIHYSHEAEDVKFIQTHWDALVKALAWIETSAKDPNGELLIQGPFADWADSIDRRGRVLYTNVLYWQALREMSTACLRLENQAGCAAYKEKAERVATAIQKTLWRPSLGYFAASDALDHLTSSGNLLAIAWGLATEEQASMILEAMDKAEMSTPVPAKVAHPPYPMHLIALENRLIGAANYHTDAAWMWIGAWHVIALARVKRLEESHTLLARIADLIVHDRQIHEVYSPMANRSQTLVHLRVTAYLERRHDYLCSPCLGAYRPHRSRLNQQR